MEGEGIDRTNPKAIARFLCVPAPLTAHMLVGLRDQNDGPTMRHDADEFTMILDTSNIWVIKEFVKQKKEGVTYFLTSTENGMGRPLWPLLGRWGSFEWSSLMTSKRRNVR